MRSASATSEGSPDSLSVGNRLNSDMPLVTISPTLTLNSTTRPLYGLFRTLMR